MNASNTYRELSKWYALTPPFVSVLTLFIDAPFGRFALPEGSKWLLDGIKSWIVMEIICPISFLAILLLRPLVSDTTIPPLLPSFKDPRTLLASLFLIHYINRALISPLRSPPRSKTHIVVPLAGLFFQTINGSLLGSYFSSPQAYRFLNLSAGAEDKSTTAFSRPSFWLGITLWTAGFVGNVLHDEILMNIRRNALQKKTEAKEKPGPSSTKSSKPYYAIPHGYLYTYISYPNYFCEWVEWAGFALASAPFPALSTYEGVTTAAPPWLFFFSLVFLMGSRAYRGHLWYHSKFPEYPKERKAVIPFVL